MAQLAAVRDGVLSIHQLRACGLDDHAVARRVRDGALHRLYRGVYAVGHPGLTLRGRFRAAVLACGESAVLSHFAAAVFWGFWTWDDRPIDVTDKQARLEAVGLRVVRITWRQITDSPQQTLARIRAALD